MTAKKTNKPSGAGAQCTKRARGQFFTTSASPFELEPFQEWAKAAGLPQARILEPFAGANHIIHALQDLDLCEDFASYDIAPAAAGVRRRDTLRSFPRGFDVCVTNPPWLAKNSATRRGLPFPASQYDNLYKHCLEQCLDNCGHVAALLPASYLQSRLFRGRLQTYILLHDLIFADTENPVCLALFAPEKSDDAEVYYDEHFIGNLAELERKMPAAKRAHDLRFNDPAGQLGFVSFDNTREASIHFCTAEEIEAYEIKESSRFITRIGGDFGGVRRLARLIKSLNERLEEMRAETRDLLLTPFKGMRQDGEYRRRMFFSQARDLINVTI